MPANLICSNAYSAQGFRGFAYGHLSVLIAANLSDSSWLISSIVSKEASAEPRQDAVQMTQNNDENGDLPDRFMKQLSQTALQDMLAAAIAGTLKNRRAGIRRIYTIHYIKNSAKVVRIMNFMHPPPSCLRTWMEHNMRLEVNFVLDGVEQKPLPAGERDLRSDEFLANLPANHFTFEENMLRVALVKYCA